MDNPVVIKEILKTSKPHQRRHLYEVIVFTYLMLKIYIKMSGHLVILRFIIRASLDRKKLKKFLAIKNVHKKYSDDNVFVP